MHASAGAYLGKLVFSVSVGIALVCCTCFGQTLEDYKKASESKGCGLTPDSNLQHDCDGAQEDVEKYCKSSDRKFSCGQDLDRKDKEEISKRIRNGDACLEKRQKIAKIFDMARSRLRDQTAGEEKRKYAAICVEKIEREAANHKKAIEDTESAIFYCKQLLNP